MFAGTVLFGKQSLRMGVARLGPACGTLSKGKLRAGPALQSAASPAAGRSWTLRCQDEALSRAGAYRRVMNPAARRGQPSRFP